MNLQKNTYTTLRYVMSFIFLWAFFDKTFGLGFATKTDMAWIHGGSPTTGFLSHAVRGPFVDFFHSLAGVALVDWLFMLGLLGTGLALLFRRYVLWGAVSGVSLLLLMWAALLLPENNPIIDDHIVYALVLVLLAIESRTTYLE